MKEKPLNQKIAEINSLWDNEQNFVQFMPEREMYYCPGGDCNCHSDENHQLIDSVTLDESTDWLSWELEMME